MQFISNQVDSYLVYIYRIEVEQIFLHEMLDVLKL